MDAFLADLKNLSKGNESKVFNAVLGNESGDLDSFVSSVALAFHLTTSKGVRHVPLMAFDRRDLDLRTEVLYCFRRLNLEPANLAFADDLDQKMAKGVDRVVLVDHNRVNNPALTALDAKVAAVIDHHALERSAAACEGVDVTVRTVGSCSTLVAEKIFADDPGFKARPHIISRHQCTLSVKEFLDKPISMYVYVYLLIVTGENPIED